MNKMDLVPNSNGFVNNGNYFEGNKIIPRIVGIAGTNASGKSSIIEALRLLKLFHSRELFMILSPICIQEENIKKYFESQSNISKTKQIGGFGNNAEFKYLTNYSDTMSNNKKYLKFTSSIEIQNSLTKIMNNFYVSIFNDNARNKKNDIEIEVEVEENMEIYLFKMIINKNGVKLLTKTNDGKSQNSKIFNKFQNSLFLSSLTSRTLAPIKIQENLNVHFASDLNQNMQRGEFAEKVMMDKRIWTILKMADPVIEKIYFNDKLKETRVVLKSKKDISINSISLGSRKLIELSNDILRAEKANGILLCDELENSLNQSIVSAIKTLAKKANIQLIFTSHSGETLSNDLDNKQIFILDTSFDLEEEEMVSDIWKFSSKFNKNNRFNSIYNKKLVASPSVNSISNFLEELLNESNH